jgi:hypothetical protein
LNPHGLAAQRIFMLSAAFAAHVPTKNSRHAAGARGESRTRTPREGQGILSPLRLPFRHPGPRVTLKENEV